MKTLSLVLLSLSLAACSSAPSEEVGASHEELRRLDAPHVACNPQTVSCATGSFAVTKHTSFACISYCVTCPEIDAIVCNPDDEFISGKDENGCDYAYCKPPGEPPHVK
jgi:hypothetical protein